MQFIGLLVSLHTLGGGRTKSDTIMSKRDNITIRFHTAGGDRSQSDTIVVRDNIIIRFHTLGGDRTKSDTDSCETI